MLKRDEFLSSVNPRLQESSPTRSARCHPEIVAASNALVVVQEEAVTHYPPTDDSYVSMLPLPPYGSTEHMTLHVTEALQLALRVLTKNKVIGRKFSDQDVELLQQIVTFLDVPVAAVPTE